VTPFVLNVPGSRFLWQWLTQMRGFKLLNLCRQTKEYYLKLATNFTSYRLQFIFIYNHSGIQQHIFWIVKCVFKHNVQTHKQINKCTKYICSSGFLTEHESYIMTRHKLLFQESLYSRPTFYTGADGSAVGCSTAL
jgi:hypothetical protein